MSRTKKVSIDVGNGLTCAAMLYKNQYELISFPSIRTAIDLAGSFDDDADLTQFHWDPELMNISDRDLLTTYVVGDEAHRKAGFTEADRSFERYADEFDLFMIMVALVKLNQSSGRLLNKSDEVDLTVCVPPSYMSDQIVSKYEDIVGTYNVYVNGDSTPHQYTICNVNVIEEGRGALFAFGIGKDGKPNQYFDEIIMGKTIRLIDIGYRTVDSYVIDNGKIADISRFGLTEDIGLYPGVVIPILQKLHGRGGDYQAISEFNIELAIRSYARGEIDKCGTMVGTEWIQLYQAINRRLAEYERQIRSKFMESNMVTKGMRGVNHLLIVGGGGSLLEPIVKNFYPQKLIQVKEHPATCGIQDAHIYLNAIGNLLWMYAKENK